MEQKRLNLYLIDMKYIRNLAKADDHVMSVSPQAGKETRPFVGIVIVCGTRKYCVPLSSPKPKHSSMKYDVDFMKIMDGEKMMLPRRDKKKWRQNSSIGVNTIRKLL